MLLDGWMNDVAVDGCGHIIRTVFLSLSCQIHVAGVDGFDCAFRRAPGG